MYWLQKSKHNVIFTCSSARSTSHCDLSISNRAHSVCKKCNIPGIEYCGRWPDSSCCLVIIPIPPDNGPTCPPCWDPGPSSIIFIRSPLRFYFLQRALWEKWRQGILHSGIFAGYSWNLDENFIYTLYRTAKDSTQFRPLDKTCIRIIDTCFDYSCLYHSFHTNDHFLFKIKYLNMWVYLASLIYWLNKKTWNNNNEYRL